MTKSEEAKTKAALPEWAQGSNLSAKQALFVDEYLIDFNATQAAIRAGYSKKTAAKIGFENLQKPEIQAAIAKRLKDRSERTQITQDRVLEELARVGFSDIRRSFSPTTGALLLPEQWDDDHAAAMASVKVTYRSSGEVDENGNPIPEAVAELKPWDKLSALDKIGRHLGMWNDKMQIDASSELLEAARSITKAADSVRPGGLDIPEDE